MPAHLAIAMLIASGTRMRVYRLGNTAMGLVLRHCDTESEYKSQILQKMRLQLAAPFTDGAYSAFAMAPIPADDPS